MAANAMGFASPHFAAALISILTAALAFPLLLRWGLSSAARWIEPAAAQSLRAYSLPWWLLAVLLAATLGLSHGGSWMASWGPSLDLPVGLWLSSCLVGLWAACLCALAQIDLKTRLLPDALTAFMVATGLLFHAINGMGNGAGMGIGIQHALIGAAAGYAGLWALAKAFELVRRQNAMKAMGRGDFAMLAGIGAWVGWQQLPLVVLVASLTGLVVAAASGLIAKGRYIPFGPALAVGGVIAWLGHPGLGFGPGHFNMGHG
jgi:leader peptidase (prepilin peptidase) / N-methyltransferase